MAARAPGDTSFTRIARASSAYHEEQVLVTRSLENEKRVTAVRLVALTLMGVSQVLVRDVSGEPDTEGVAHHLVILGYFLFTVSAFVAVRRITPNSRIATVAPLIATTFDIAFVVAMDWLDSRTDGIELEGTVAVLALIMSYSLLRYRIHSLIWSTALAIAAFTAAMVWSRQFAWAGWSFVAFTFVATALLLAATRLAVRKMFIELLRRESLSRLVPPKVVDEILAGRADRLRPTRREVTVLFADLRGFTSYGESRPPEVVLALLDDFFGRMTLVVQGHGGSVNKFLGDGLLALWGAPDPLPDHPQRAVKAARDMQRVMAELREAQQTAGEPPLRLGIGVHTGEVAAGMLGGGTQSEYTVIGDAVNLASRIEGLTRVHDVDILVSDTTWQRLEGQFPGRRVAEAQVKGRRAPVVVHAIDVTYPE
jgi:adenylate cyclase